MGQLRRTKISSTDSSAKNQILKLLSRTKHGNFLHDFSLRGQSPLYLIGTPKDLWPGSVTTGTYILGNKFVAAGQILLNSENGSDQWPKDEIWLAEDLNEAWQEYIQSFSWLKDLNQAVDKVKAKQRAEQLVEGWMNIHSQWGDISWRVDIVGVRVVNWLMYAPLIMDNENLEYRSVLLDLLARSARYLYKESNDFPDGPRGLRAIFALIHAGLFIPNGDKWIKKGISLLKSKLAIDVLMDGGIGTRNPLEQHHLLMELISLREALLITAHGIPAELFMAIARMATHLRSMIHGDGKIALFNGAYIQNHEDIYKTLSKSNEGISSLFEMEQSGYSRIEKDKTLIIQDVGPPAKMNLSLNCHVGTLAFEMSRGSERLIVNCGHAAYSQEAKGVDMHKLSRSTAAHSTVILENKNSSEICDNGLIGQGVTYAYSKMYEQNDHALLETSHDGYVEPFNLMHNRLIYVNDTGHDVRGEDILVQSRPDVKIEPIAFDVRFHIHPNVVVKEDKNSNSVSLEMTNGEKWIFIYSGAKLTLDDSVYFGNAGRVVSCRQIVLSGDCEAEQTTVYWSFKLGSEEEKH
jgi:uncharacterized heparinase superfamily protein